MILPLLAIIFLCCFILANIIIWPYIRFDWLSHICRFLVISLPFERIPSVDFGFGNLRISQILVLFGLWFFLVLAIKQNKELLSHKFNPHNLWVLAFFVATFPSWFQVQSFKRFIVTILGTILVFAAFFLLSNFTVDVLKRLKELGMSMVFACLFGIYQFAGDMVGLPPILTGLREQYTKVVFGIPRVHSTALEPLYFAGMLFAPIFTAIVFILARKHFFKQSFYYSNLVFLLLFCLMLALTLSKGGYLAFLAAFVPFSYFLFTKFNPYKLIKSVSWLGAFAAITFTFVILFSQDLLTIFIGIFDHIIKTFTLDSGTSMERLTFLEIAWYFLFKNIIIGIGSGQYGVVLKDISTLGGADNFLIVNNVYVEIWLEFGLLGLAVFLVFLFKPILSNFFSFFDPLIDWKKDDQLARYILTFSLIAYSIQWLFFSPIFIMPIFILLGLLGRLDMLEKSIIKDMTVQNPNRGMV